MAESNELLDLVRNLQSIEDIKRLKAKYWRCVDQKRWEEIGECFAEDCVADYGQGMVLNGRQAIVEFLRKSLGQATSITAHGGHNPEIDITGPDTARAIWNLNDIVIMPGMQMKGYGYYEDTYVKQNGKWMKKSTTIKRIVEQWDMQKR